MYPLAPDYLALLAGQLGGVSAFLGGFAATFLALFLTLGEKSRAASIASLASALAAAAFILTVIASVSLVAATHPHAPAGAAATWSFSHRILSLSFLIGMISLLAAIGASGWVRSKRLGCATTATALIVVVIAPMLLR